ncbi:putative Integral membrane protein [Seiridium unicorne]|uniref:Integral membrane protein n=1 Tax=Seiridium unicorne TaxID=138068 RepID=A0ABR2V932_9PEZI
MAQGDDDRGPEIFDVTLSLLVISTIAVALRCYVRIAILKSFRIEDYLALATLASFAFFCACVFLSVEHGAGKHLLAVPFSNLSDALLARWLGEIAYILTSVFLKFTVGIFLLRICSRQWQTTVIWGVLAIVLIFNIVYMFIAIAQCQPIDYFWNRVTSVSIKGTCVSKELGSGSTYAATAVNAFADLTLGLLPIALVWNVELNRRAKISVAGILALGILRPKLTRADYRASAATLVRIPYVWQLTHSIDFLYVFTDFTIWSTVENGVGIIASSIATLRPLFRKAVDLTRGSSAPAHPARYSGTVRRDSVRGTVFHCRGLSEDYDVEKAQRHSRRKVVVSGEVDLEKPEPALIGSDKGKEKETSPQRVTFDHQSTNSGWSWNSRDPRNSRNHGVGEWVEDWGDSARSSRSRLVSARSSRRTTW